MFNFKALWSNTSADGMCDTIVYDSMRLWASAVENYYTSINKDRLNIILPHTKCWNSTNMDMNNIKYHYGKNFYKSFRKFYRILFFIEGFLINSNLF